MGSIIIIVTALVLDRLTKYTAAKYLSGIFSVPILRNVFHLTYSRNTGAAFGIFEGKTLYLILFTFVVIAAMIWFLIIQRKKNSESKLFICGLSMIIGGALGNLIDRVIYGYVIDFFDFRLIDFPIFNVADCFITVGAVCFCAALIFDKRIRL